MSMFYEKPLRFDELYHYGVIGMRWGVRKKTGHTRKEIRADNKKAFDIGREATLTSGARKTARHVVQKTEDKIKKASSKGKDTRKLEERLKIAKKAEKSLAVESKERKREAFDHRMDLIKKYGSEHVSNIKTDSSGRVNERVVKAKTFVTGVALTAASVAVGPPGGFLLVRPKTKGEMIRDR